MKAWQKVAIGVGVAVPIIYFTARALAKPPTLPPPPPSMGTLIVDTTPVKGEVLVDGVSLGKAPQSRNVVLGSYTVSFGDVSGYTTPVAQTVIVSENMTTNVMGTYTPTTPPPSGKGTLSVDTTPIHAPVYVNEVFWGIAPQSRNVDLGSYVVRFSDAYGYITPAPQTVTVKENMVTSVMGYYAVAPPPPPIYPSPTTEADAQAFYEKGVADGSILPGTEIHGELYYRRTGWRHQVIVKAASLEAAGAEYHSWWELKPDGSLLRRQELVWLTGEYEVFSEMTYYEFWEGDMRFTQGLYGAKPGDRYYLPSIVDTYVPSWAYEGSARASSLDGIVALGVPKEALDIGVAMG